MYSDTYLHISHYIFIVQVDEHRGVILEYNMCLLLIASVAFVVFLICIYGMFMYLFLILYFNY